VAKTVVGHRQSVRRLERWWVAACGSSPTGMSDDAVSAVASTARMSARHRPLDEAYRDRSTSEAGPLDVEKRGALEEAYHSTSEAKGEAAPTAAAVAQLRSQPSIPLIISRTRRIGRSVRALATTQCLVPLTAITALSVTLSLLLRPLLPGLPRSGRLALSFVTLSSWEVPQRLAALLRRSDGLRGRRQ